MSVHFCQNIKNTVLKNLIASFVVSFCRKVVTNNTILHLQSNSQQLCKFQSKTVSDWLNPLPNDKSRARTKLKALADNKFNVVKRLISLTDRVENIVGKRENAGYQHFILFLQCFQMLLCQGC